MARDLFANLLGKDPADAETNWEAMRKAVSFVGRDGISALAMSALDTACWDLAAQAAGEPLWKYFGGERREIPCYAKRGPLAESLDRRTRGGGRRPQGARFQGHEAARGRQGG